jgi:hypothetical protein
VRHFKIIFNLFEFRVFLKDVFFMKLGIVNLVQSLSKMTLTAPAKAASESNPPSNQQLPNSTHEKLNALSPRRLSQGTASAASISQPKPIAAPKISVKEVRALMERGSAKDLQILCSKIEQGRLPAAAFKTKIRKDVTLLHLIAAHATPSVVNLVLDQEGDLVNALDNAGQTSLHYAAGRAKPGVISALIAAGAIVDIQDGAHRTPLHQAARYASTPEDIQVFLAAGAQSDNRNNAQRTPLHVAARFSKSVEVVDSLIVAGGDVNALDLKGHTALYWAVKHSAVPEIVQALINADPQLPIESKDPAQTTGRIDAKEDDWNVLELPGSVTASHKVGANSAQILLDLAKARPDKIGKTITLILEKQSLLDAENAWAIV